MKRRIFLVLAVCSTSIFGQTATEQETDSLFQHPEIELNPLVITEKLPVTTQKLSSKEIKKKNLGQDIPSLIGSATSVVTTSDAGAGIGYSSFRIRGIPQTQINVTVNGIPINDAESQSVFWVNMPDLASSTNSIVIQRGVGTSSGGNGAFGAVINIETENNSKKSFIETANSWGSFNSQKYTLKGGTGKIFDGKFSLDGRVSVIHSDGYMERASSDLISYEFTAEYDLNKNTSFRFWQMNGREKTYQAWDGIDGKMLKINRKFNPAGAIYNEDYSEIIGYYDNQTDNYRQSHNHFSWAQRFDNWKTNLTLHYTYGKGYYEEYKQDRKLEEYKVFDDISTSDLVRRKWLNNDLYGLNLMIENQNLGNFKFFGGVSASRFENNHYGRVIWIENIYLPRNEEVEYYRNKTKKDDISAYAKGLFRIGAFELFGDLQYRYVNYKTKYKAGGENDFEDFRPFEDTFHFFNPKAGINYHANANNVLYFSYGMAQREPTRTDYKNNTDIVNNIVRKPKSETLHDFELGYKKSGKFRLNANAFYMYYLDQLIPTGQIDESGYPIRKNSGKSFRAGFELETAYELIHEKFFLFGNLTWSSNKNIDFKEETYDSEGNLKTIHYGDTKIAFSPEWISSFGLEIYPFKNLMINFSNKFVGEQYLSNTEPKDGKLKSYFVSDLLLRYSPKCKGISDLEFSLLINNIFDSSYENNGYYYDQAFYFPQAGINILGGIKLRL